MSAKTPSPMIATLLILGGTVFGVLGALHAAYTLLTTLAAGPLVHVQRPVTGLVGSNAGTITLRS